MAVMLLAEGGSRCGYADDKKERSEGGAKSSGRASSSEVMEARQMQEVMDASTNANAASSSSSATTKATATTTTTEEDADQRNTRGLIANPFLPDYTTNSCKNDKPAESWVTQLTPTVLECCNANFLWILDECVKKSNSILLTSTSSTSVSTGTGSKVMYYPDSTDGKCKEDGPSRPSWITTLEADFALCCTKHLPWSGDSCLLAKPPKKSPTPVANAAPVARYYPDSGVGLCKEDGPARPSWITAIETDYATCCANWFAWNLQPCLAARPPPPTPPPIAPVTASPIVPVNPQSYITSFGNGTPKAPAPAAAPELSNPLPPANGNPTVRPTSAPTQPPTRHPVTMAPTQLYYAMPANGLCSVVDGNKPAWITNTYSSYSQCCQVESWDKIKCLAAMPAGAADNGNGDDVLVQNSAGGSSSSNGEGLLPGIVIEVTVYGSIELANMIVPEATSQKFSKLKIALTKSMILVLTESKLVHPGLDVQLWSIGGQNFNWRRSRNLEEVIEQIMMEEEEEEDVAAFGDTADGGSAEQRHVRRRENSVAAAPQVLQFEMAIPTACNSDCQSNLNGHLGQVEYDAINDYFQNSILTGAFSTTLKKQGEAMGLFSDSVPIVSTGQLSYRYAIKSDLTWMPTSSPTSSPEIPPSSSPSRVPSPVPTVSAPPTGQTYYPDYIDTMCRVVGDGKHSEFEINFFNSVEDCVSFCFEL